MTVNSLGKLQRCRTGKCSKKWRDEGITVRLRKDKLYFCFLLKYPKLGYNKFLLDYLSVTKQDLAQDDIENYIKNSSQKSLI